MRAVHIEVPLSRLVPNKKNPRRVKPAREAHDRLVALIRLQGLLHPLVVRKSAKPKCYEVVAGDRRLAALKEVHKGNGDPKIPCLLKDGDEQECQAVSLGENFGREPMHPLDEAEAFAGLASSDGKDAKTIGEEFGVGEKYVRQRMKLATLAKVIKAAYRDNEINTAMAAAFASVPEDRQLEVWKEVNGHPQHAEHVRNVIANSWIDARHALFDVSTLPANAVSRDLFSEKVLIERKAFMEAQSEPLKAKQAALTDDGWHEVVVGERTQIIDRLYSMETPERELDDATNTKLSRLAEKQKALEAKAEEIDHNDAKAVNALERKFTVLQEEEQAILNDAPLHFSEETKALATAFLILDPNGQVHTEYRVPRTRHKQHGKAGGATGEGESDGPKPPTSEDLSERQLASVFTHQALMVRQALLQHETARKRLLVLLLHENIRSEAIAMRHDANAITLATNDEGFTSPIVDRLRELRTKLDPFGDKAHVEDEEAYAQLAKMKPAKLDALIDLLLAETITAHLTRPTKLIDIMVQEFELNIREYWMPDAEWFAGYQKLQLSHLMGELLGAVYDPKREIRKKSELVSVLATLFVDAAEAKLDDKKLAQRVNQWVPVNLRGDGSSRK
jgi:ParB family chromosome partitioning protein